MSQKRYATFADWTNEIEGSGTRAGRAVGDVHDNPHAVVKWLRTAWELGAAAEREACATIAKYQTTRTSDETDLKDRILAAIRARRTP